MTPLPQPGNEKPRLFRLKSDEALINRMGFNNQGATSLACRLRAIKTRRGPIGVNIGKNKITPNDQAISDYVKAFKAVVDGADYIAVNISSPNTPGLRDLQSVTFLLDLLAAIEPVRAVRNLPVFVKISPDLADESVIEIGQALANSPYAANLGLIATNTTIERVGLTSKEQTETGGLSGKPLADRSTAVVRLLVPSLGNCRLSVAAVSSLRLMPMPRFELAPALCRFTPRLSTADRKLFGKLQKGWTIC
ncbi:hypothetical protein GCM10025858_30610 [Alicyclobacillus sacchari]|nr:hypothetical protein GCM10025858_30610 [Alicyclobacillus sacchari]